MKEWNTVSVKVGETEFFGTGGEKKGKICSNKNKFSGEEVKSILWLYSFEILHLVENEEKEKKT